MFDFKTIQIQASIFTPELPPRNSRLLAHFLSKRGDLFSGEPITYDQSPNMRIGLHTPRLILSGEDRTFRVQVASGRFDVIKVTPTPTVGVDQEAHLALAVDLLGEYLEITKGTVDQLSFTLVHASLDEDPARTISSRFCRDEWLGGPISDPTSFELGVQNMSPLGDGLESVSSLRCRSGQLINPVDRNSQGMAVVVEQDLSTVEDDSDSREFTADEIRRFFVLAPDEQRRIFDLYFPRSERIQ